MNFKTCSLYNVGRCVSFLQIADGNKIEMLKHEAEIMKKLTKAGSQWCPAHFFSGSLIVVCLLLY